MTEPELISEELMDILTAKPEGLTAGEIYDESRMAINLAQVTGALNRLRNAGMAQRGSDKRWRLHSRTGSAPAKPAEPPPRKPARPMSQNEAMAAIKKAASVVQQPKPPSPPPAEPKPVEPPEPEVWYTPDWLITSLEAEFDAAQVRLDRYVAELGDEVLVHLVEMTLAAGNALDAARARGPK